MTNFYKIVLFKLMASLSLATYANGFDILQSADPMGDLADSNSKIVTYMNNELQFAYRDAPKEERPTKDYLQKFFELFKSPHQPLKAFETCTTQAARLKKGPIIQSIQDMHIWFGENLPQWLGYHYLDMDFLGLSQVYWLQSTKLGEIFQLEFDSLSFQRSWKHLSELHEDVELFKDRNQSNSIDGLGWVQEVTQGHIGNCYLISAMTSLSLKPDRLKEVFITKQSNKAGIYTLRFFVRGIPSYITVDDTIYYIDTDEETGPTYSRISEDFPSIWGPILEKGWAKLMGNFQNTIGGSWRNAIRALIGCPTISYQVGALAMQWSGAYLHKFIHYQSKVYWKFMFALGTKSEGCGDGTDQSTNFCGITCQHSIAILDTFVLWDESKENVLHRMYMLRDPRGPLTKVRSQRNFNVNDTIKWTDDFRAQVPYGIDPLDEDFFFKTGIFFMDSYGVIQCFDSLDQAFDRHDDGYFNSYYDFQADSLYSDQEHEFSFVIPKSDGDMYITVESYFSSMTDSVCYLEQNPDYKYANYTYEISKNGVPNAKILDLFPRGKPDWYQWFTFYSSDCEYYPNRCFVAGDIITVKVKYNWNFNLGSRDFSVVVYSKQDLQIKDKDGKTNQLRYDGTEPKGFTDWISYSRE